MIFKEKPDPKIFETVFTNKSWDIMTQVYENIQSFIINYEFDNAYKYYGQATSDSNLEYPQFSNFTSHHKDVLDHIFFSKNK